MRRQSITKKLLIIISLGILCVSCNKDDKGVWEKIDDIEARVVKLESLCNRLNTNIVSLQEIIEVLNNQDCVKSVTPIMENGDVIGYTITFVKSNPITIYHGKDGANGVDGKDGVTPVISVKKDVDNVWYWTINGDWLLNGDGTKIIASGKDGIDGKDGKDGTTPQLKIEGGYWYVSLDNGQTWTQQGKATGEDGANGIDGKDGDSMFREISQDDKFVYFILTNDQVIQLPKWVETEDPYLLKFLILSAAQLWRMILKVNHWYFFGSPIFTMI